MSNLDLMKYGIRCSDLRHNCSVAELYQDSVCLGEAVLASTGALCTVSGDRCGRSPADKRIVEHTTAPNHICWGPVNMPMRPVAFRSVRQRAVDYLNTFACLYVVDGFLGWDPRYRLKVRLFAARPYHALFLKNMLIEPTEQEQAEFGEPDIVVFNSGTFPADAHTPDLNSSTCIALDLAHRQLVILGTEYAGEMKKGLFTLLNDWLPSQNVLSLHAAANEGSAGDVTVLLGLSGTGKTTLSMDPHRRLIGDDELGWSAEGVFNLEGGCYAKCIDLTRTREPIIYRSIRFGTVLENVAVNPQTHRVDFADRQLTENTRASYPITHVPNAKLPSVGGHPANIVLLTCDAFGVLPPVSRLDLQQAIDFFGLGYTAKVAGTEVGIKEPLATFSPCFAGPFLVRHPSQYIELFRQRLVDHPANCWLVNTGWTAGETRASN